ncbi:unnamed protein product [Adineta steineri]|uniref:G-protein coupled receptors family 1 profile domain-containing protein n=1 Tax=Adineta steineri TaxID=433720 RepID=A0A815VSZ9_9BILA|nr:unnamed protein product [Adineta steineri]CAF1532852.1 unnamed protein product [Adineta steineri]
MLPTLSLNQPKFPLAPIWDSNGITIADGSIVGQFPYAIFVNTNNTIYVANKENNTIVVWNEESVNPTKIIHGNFTRPSSLFVTSNGDIYIDDGEKNGRVQRWSADTYIFVTVMNVNLSCWGLFVDINDTLYCSMYNHHQVVKRSLNEFVMTSNRVAAGTGIGGSSSNQLNTPVGIFVDMNLDLYVADYGNDRVQLFQSGESNGITVAGSTSRNPTITLNHPTGIILDADKYLFIADFSNHRIVGSGLNGFRCLVGCYGGGSQSNQLILPISFSFGCSGNMFVTDSGNSRIQKFFLMKDSFALSFNQPKFCATAAWNSNGITFANESILGEIPNTIFVSINNTIYAANRENSTVLMWDKESDNLTNIIQGNFTDPRSLFVTLNGDIYINNGGQNRGVQKWIVESKTFVTVMNVNSSCFGLFVDINDTLYCSMSVHDQVVKRSLNNSVMTSNRVAAGTGIGGSASNQLNTPVGIFVEVNLDLYVADSSNNRVQLFQSGESNGITVAGSTSRNPTITLNHPTGIILDADKYLFIVEQDSGRIVGSSLNGFRCLVGCNEVGSQSNQLALPYSLSFDRSGNMFVPDTFNNRIQKFQYVEESCGNSSVIKSVYSLALTTNSSSYFQECSELRSYYEAIQISVTITGYYTFLINSEMKATYGYIYTNNFNVFNWLENRLIYDGDSNNAGQFRLTALLQTNIIHVVVITTSSPNITGNVSIQVSGPNYIDFRRILNASSAVQTVYTSTLTTNSSTYLRSCSGASSYYEAIQVNVVTSGLYIFFSKSNMGTYGSIYEDYFNPSNPDENHLLDKEHSYYSSPLAFKIALKTSITYILVVTTRDSNITGAFSIFVSGPNKVDLKNISSPSVIEIPYSSTVESNYSSELTTSSQTYSRDCRKSNYYYQTIRMNVVETGYYALTSDSNMDTFGDSSMNMFDDINMDTFGYIYKDDFNPINPFENRLPQDYRACSHSDFKFIAYLHTGTTYILVVTTSSPNIAGNFSILTSGPNNITLDPYTQILTSCFIGQKCQFYKKSIGVTLDDILRDEIRPNMTLSDQTILVKINAGSTMIMLVGGLINSILSLITFQNKDLRQVGCGIYLLASSITSFLTLSMFTVKFWFVVLTQMDLSIRPSVVRGGCVSIEPLLKLCLYLDAWLNACVAIERAILVFRGVNFNKKNSQRIARWIILILPFCIMGSIIHEPIHRELYEMKTETNKVDTDRWCLTRYSPFVQQYNTIILFFHLVAPCIINLCSALFIIFGSARQRSTARTKRTLREHVYNQFNEHKQLLISPIILLILSLPRLIMSMLSECVNPSNHRLLFIFGYFISFTPSMLIFIVFVLPSALYRKTFQESFRRWRRLIHH